MQCHKFESVDFKYDNSVLKCCQKHPNKAIFDSNLIFVFTWNLFKFEDADFNYDISFLKLLPINTQIRHFSSLSREFLFLPQTFTFQIFESVDFTYGHRFFKLLPNNTQIRYFWSKKFIVRYFWSKSLLCY